MKSNQTEPVQPKLVRGYLDLPVEFRAPGSEAEKVICGIWRYVLNIDSVGVDDDFFDLSGDSLAAAMLAGAIEQKFLCKFSPSEIMVHSTVSSQARYCVQATENTGTLLPGYVFGVNLDGSKPPLFLIHGNAGYLLIGNEFFRTLGSDQPVYVFQAPGIDGKEEPRKTVEEYAADYSAVLQKVLPGGPWRIAGSCAGSMIVLEMCHMLSGNGAEVEKVVMLDPNGYPPSAILNRSYGVKTESLGARLRRLVHRIVKGISGRGFKREKQPMSYDELLIMIADKYRERINNRALGAGPISAEVEASYNPDDVLRTTLTLHDALVAYKPRPWPGKVKMILSSARWEGHEKHSFWEDHLGAIDYTVIKGRHEELFKKNLGELAQSLKAFLEDTKPDHSVGNHELNRVSTMRNVGRESKYSELRG